MIIDAPEFMPTFECKKILAEYLMYKKNIPLVSVSGNLYYFVDNALLKEVLEGLPLWIKILKLF